MGESRGNEHKKTTLGLEREIMRLRYDMGKTES